MKDQIRFMNRFKRYYAAGFQPLAREYGLNQLEIDILLFLHNNPDCNTASDIVELRGLAKSNVSTAIERLHQEGYLEVTPDRSNRRKRRLYLRPEREPVIRRLAEQQSICLHSLTKGFTAEELRLLHNMVDRMEENMNHAD